MKPFTEELRYSYPLTEKSLIVDLGGYHGTWFKTMVEKYGCRAAVFEPYKEFFDRCHNAAKGLPDVRLVNAAVRRWDTSPKTIGVKGDMTGFFTEGMGVPVRIYLIEDLMLDHPVIDVMKINVEGCEFEILEYLLDSGRIYGIANIQVQFHCGLPGSKEEQAEIESRLNVSHYPEWETAHNWQNWRIR